MACNGYDSSLWYWQRVTRHDCVRKRKPFHLACAAFEESFEHNDNDEDHDNSNMMSTRCITLNICRMTLVRRDVVQLNLQRLVASFNSWDAWHFSLER